MTPKEFIEKWYFLYQGEHYSDFVADLDAMIGMPDTDLIGKIGIEQWNRCNQMWIDRIQALSDYCPVNSFMGEIIPEIQAKLLESKSPTAPEKSKL